MQHDEGCVASYFTGQYYIFNLQLLKIAYIICFAVCSKLVFFKYAKLLYIYAMRWSCAAYYLFFNTAYYFTYSKN